MSMLGSYSHVLHRIDNAPILSEELEESSVRALIDVAIADLFPDLCDKWYATNQDIRTRYKEELGKRINMVHQEIATGLNSLQCTLREVVVEDVLRLFPYVLIDDVIGSTVMTDVTCCRSLEADNLSASVQLEGCSRSDASQEATCSVPRG